jgi:hypothetical protein
VVNSVLGALGGLAQAVLELGEEHLDRVQVRRVLRQEEELGARSPEDPSDGAAHVRTEVVHDDDVAGAQGRDKDLVDVKAESFAIDRAIDPSTRSWRRAARNVMVVQRPCGTLAAGAGLACAFSIGACWCQALSGFSVGLVLISVAGSALLFGIGTEALP